MLPTKVSNSIGITEYLTGWEIVGSVDSLELIFSLSISKSNLLVLASYN